MYNQECTILYILFIWYYYCASPLLSRLSCFFLAIQFSALYCTLFYTGSIRIVCNLIIILSIYIFIETPIRRGNLLWAATLGVERYFNRRAHAYYILEYAKRTKTEHKFSKKVQVEKYTCAETNVKLLQ